MLFKQLFDKESCTYTYLTADLGTKEAVLIDPVDTQLDEYLNLLQENDLTLKYSLETHVHAGHVTASGLLRQQARHATSWNSGTPVTIIHSLTERMGDTLVALRPPRLRTKAASSWLPQMTGRLFGMQFLPPSRAASALRIGELPCRLPPGTKKHHFAKAPFT